MPQNSIRISFPNKESMDRFKFYMDYLNGSEKFFELEEVNQNITNEDKIVMFEEAQGPDCEVWIANTRADCQ